MAGYGSNSSDFHTPNDPVHGKQIAHKDTNEPVLTLTKRPYGNEYDSKVHPEFEENHLRHLKDKLMPHEINDLLNGKGHGKAWSRDTKMRIASELYNKAYAAYNSHQEPKTTYKHSGKDENGMHHYNIYNPDGDHVGVFHSNHGPNQLSSDSSVPISSVQNVPTKHSNEIHDLAKSKYIKPYYTGSDRTQLKHVLLLHKKLDELSGEEPNFVGADKHGAAHKSFNTKLPPREAVSAYVNNLKKKSLDPDAFQELHNSGNAASYMDTKNKVIHHIVHSDGKLHHTHVDLGKSTAKNDELIESLKAGKHLVIFG